MTYRQIYKWLWDEEHRYQTNLTLKTKEEISSIETAITREYKKMKRDFKKNVANKGLWIVDKIFIPKNKIFSDKVNRKIWEIKMKGIIEKSIFMQLRRGRYRFGSSFGSL